MAVNAGYNKFHGKMPRAKSKQSFHVPKNLVWLGKAHAVEYICTKENGGGDGKPAIYRHLFETPVHLYMDETNKKQLYIIGSRLKVTKAGIEN